MNLKFEITQELLTQKEEMTIPGIILCHCLFHKSTKENLAFIIKELTNFKQKKVRQFLNKEKKGVV